MARRSVAPGGRAGFCDVSALRDMEPTVPGISGLPVRRCPICYRSPEREDIIRGKRKKMHDEHETAATECNLNLHTDKMRFHTTEEAFGHEPALRQALLTLRNRLEKHFEQNPVTG